VTKSNKKVNTTESDATEESTPDVWIFG
jgi:hypothetical protein